MTDMRRVTVSIPQNMDKRLLELRKKSAFSRCSYSELVRRMLTIGIEADSGKPVKPNQPNDHPA